MSIHLAYIDPNSGSIVMQVVIGGLVGAGYSFRKRLAGMKALVQHRILRQRPADQDTRQ